MFIITLYYNYLLYTYFILSLLILSLSIPSIMLSEDVGKDIIDEIQDGRFVPYNITETEKLLNEIEFIDSKIEALKEEAQRSYINEMLSMNFAVLKSYKDRNLRLLRAYNYNRIKMIQMNYFIKNDIKSYLSASEADYESKYINILEEYLEDYKHLDLQNREPPLDLYVQILTLEDCGMVMSGDEFIELKKGRLYFLKKSEIAHLINKNLVKIL